MALLLLGVLAFFLLRTNRRASEESKQNEQMNVRDFFKNAEVVKAFIGAFLLMFSQGVLAYMLPLKVILLGYDAQTSGMLLSVFGITAVMIFLLPVNTVFDRIQPSFTLAFGMAMMGISLALASQIEAIQLLYLCMVLYGIGFAFLFPSLNSLLIGAVTPDHRGKAYGYFYAFFSFGVVAGSGVIGWLAFTIAQGFLFTGILLVVAAVGSLLKEPPVMKESQ